MFPKIAQNLESQMVWKSSSGFSSRHEMMKLTLQCLKFFGWALWRLDCLTLAARVLSEYRLLFPLHFFLIKPAYWRYHWYLHKIACEAQVDQLWASQAYPAQLPSPLKACVARRKQAKELLLIAGIYLLWFLKKLFLSVIIIMFNTLSQR